MRQRSDLSVEGAAAVEGFPVAPGMTEQRVPIERACIDKRVVLLCVWPVVLRHFPKRGWRSRGQRAAH
jgi:hypothetical protein